MTDRADIYKGIERAAVLTRHPDRVTFAYLPGYQGEAVATTLPVTDGEVTAPAGQLPAFFVGLLPEGRRLSALIRALKVSADDELSLLLAVGGDTVGDVRVAASGEELTDPTPYVADVTWDEVDLAQLFNKSVGGGDFDRTAIPGVQPKLSGRMISFPVAGAPGPVIVKLDPPEYSHLVENEAAILDAVGVVRGFKVPGHVVVSDKNGRTGLVVERFDRIAAAGGGIERLPVEDGCQVTGRYPADKYGLDTLEVIDALAGQCTAPAVARLQLLERYLVSYLAADGDLHARNLAIRRTSKGLWEPAPVYDVVCTAVYDDWTLAAPFGGRDNLRAMGRKRFLAGASGDLGIPEVAVERSLDRIVPLFAAAVDEALDGPAFKDFPNLEKVRRFTARRARLLLD
jgi:serine/threonine-protein kinase HipA